MAIEDPFPKLSTWKGSKCTSGVLQTVLERRAVLQDRSIWRKRARERFSVVKPPPVSLTESAPRPTYDTRHNSRPLQARPPALFYPQQSFDMRARNQAVSARVRDSGDVISPSAVQTETEALNQRKHTDCTGSLNTRLAGLKDSDECRVCGAPGVVISVSR
ncbi:hypothetical protein Bbelb_073690 [Branchiostoma belcheri]|nr:hypothetical protein Bbelb_073690 [Branchiostoma belcheri]